MNSHYQETKNFFNKTVIEKSGYYTNPKSIPYLIQKKLKEKALEWTKGSRPKKILDIGCGRGELAVSLEKFFPETKIVGVDFSEEMVKLARHSAGDNPRLEFSQADLLQLPFEDGLFDLVFCLDTLHHIHKDDLPGAIKEITRVCRGAVIIEFKNKKTIFWPLYQFLFKRANPRISCYGAEPDDIVDLFSQKGFVKEKNFPIFKHQILSPNILEKFVKR